MDTNKTIKPNKQCLAVLSAINAAIEEVGKHQFVAAFTGNFIKDKEKHNA